MGLFTEEYKYSYKEKQLIKRFGYLYCADNIPPYRMYQMMVTKAFIDNRQDKAAESLRRCMVAFDTATVHRMMPEWDEMIDL